MRQSGQRELYPQNINLQHLSLHPMDKIGKYEIIRELGSGATSTVYLALDQFNNQKVALKLFNPDAMRDTMSVNAYRKLLLTEASLAGKLAHPHIVKIRGFKFEVQRLMT